MPPVVVCYIAVILLYAEQPTAQDAVVDVEPLNKVEVEEHAETGAQGIIVSHINIIEVKVVKTKVC